jgi:CheY-like chemotaxis protein
MKVLLVEDDAELRKFYNAFLISKGNEVVATQNGEEGWTTLLAQKFDVVLLDLMMPVLDGIGFLKKRSTDELAKKVPVVVMTNLGTQDMLNECFRLGVKYYIIKAEINPIEIPTILQKAITDTHT